MKKRGKKKIKFFKLHILLGIVFLIIGITSIGIFAISQQTPTQHDGEDVSLIVDGVEKNLQDAIISGELIGEYPYDLPSSISLGHSYDEIWVSVNGVESTLEYALLHDGVCGNQETTSYSIPNLLVYHYASDIDISVDGEEMSLQDAIDNTEICCVPDCSGVENFCYYVTFLDPVCGEICQGTKQPVDGYWSVGDWGDCSDTCKKEGEDPPYQTRSVTCVGYQCGGWCPSSKPSTTRYCNNFNCVQCDFNVNGQFQPCPRTTGDSFWLESNIGKCIGFNQPDNAYFRTTRGDLVSGCNTWMCDSDRCYSTTCYEACIDYSDYIG